MVERAFDAQEYFRQHGRVRQRRDPEMISVRRIEARPRRDEDMLDHIVELVEAKAAEIEAQMSDAGVAEAAE